MDYPVITNLTLLQGSTFNPVLTALDSSGNAINWTGYKARMQVRASADSGTVLFSLYSDTSIGVVQNPAFLGYTGRAGTAGCGGPDFGGKGVLCGRRQASPGQACWG